LQICKSSYVYDFGNLLEKSLTIKQVSGNHIFLGQKYELLELFKL